MSSGEAGVEWGVGGGGGEGAGRWWARIGSLFILSKTPRKCEPGVGSGGGEGAGGVLARIGIL